MINSGEIFTAIFFFIGGLAGIGLGILFLRYDVGFIDIVHIPFVSYRYKRGYMSKEKKLEVKKKVDRCIGFSFVSLGCIVILSSLVIFFTSI